MVKLIKAQFIWSHEYHYSYIIYLDRGQLEKKIEESMVYLEL